MAYSKVNIVYLLLFSGLLYSQSPRNHAIVVGIDSYEYKENWSTHPIIKDNIDAVLDYFKTAKYNFSINILRNASASKASIHSVFEKLQLKKGDRIFLYMIGHGAQLKDINHDEKDGLDEVFVCYNSPAVNHPDFRKKSLLDDDLQKLLLKARQSIGPKGQVFMLAESCHSSTLDKSGTEVEFEDYGKRWKSAFMAEEAHEQSSNISPLIVFSSSRSNAETSAIYKFSSYFLSEFKKFNKGSYHKLFSTFYASQRTKFSEIFNTDGYVMHTVNLHVEHPEYLNYGVFEDTIYNDKIDFRVIEIDSKYPKNPRVRVNKGIYEGLTNGSSVRLLKNDLEYHGRLVEVNSGASWVDLSENNVLPTKNDLWDSDVKMNRYRYNDTLWVHLDNSITERNKLTKVIKQMNFVQLRKHTDGYTIVEIENSGRYIVRNRDSVGLYRAKDLSNTLLKLQIGKFLRNLPVQPDTITSLVIRKSNTELTPNRTHFLSKGDSLNIFIKTKHKNEAKNKYFVLLQIEDEFVQQLVPVNFQINDSECRVPDQPNSEVLIGTIVTNTMDGRLLLLTSDSPIDLREVLLKPISKQKQGLQQQLNELELLIDKLFLNRSYTHPLYDPRHLFSSEFRYIIE